MCLIVFAVRPSARVALAVAANRDEFFERPTAPAAFWDDAPDVLAGRDLKAGGTWLGVTRGGRFAALTNFRDLSVPRKDAAPSRGGLVADFLRRKEGEPERERESPSEFVARVQPRAGSFEGFNLLLSDGADFVSYSNVEDREVSLPPGVYGLSNHLLETPWPKVMSARARLDAAVARAPSSSDLEEDLLSLLSDRTVAPDADLPSTGLPLDWERALSAAFVVLPEYGTRASTCVVVADGEVLFVERRFGRGGALLGETRERFRLSATPRA